MRFRNSAAKQLANTTCAGKFPRGQFGALRIRITNMLAEYWDEANMGLLALEGLKHGAWFAELKVENGRKKHDA